MTAVLEHPGPATATVREDSARSRHRVAYVVSHYPLVSHVFIQREVRALRALGADVQVFSVHRAGAQDVLSAADAEEQAATRTVFPLDVGNLTRAHGPKMLLVVTRTVPEPVNVKPSTAAAVTSRNSAARR